MTYRPPTFNQECEVQYKPGPGLPYQVFQTMCQVRGASKVTGWQQTGGAGFLAWQTNVLILFPARTAVYVFGVEASDCFVRVGADDTTTYRVYGVWDVSQGFSNEYRATACLRLTPLPGQ